MRFFGSLWGWKLFNTTRKMYKTFTSIFLTTGSRVKTAKEINSVFKIKDGGGLLWSKLSAGIPHYARSSWVDGRENDLCDCLYSPHLRLERILECSINGRRIWRGMTGDCGSVSYDGLDAASWRRADIEMRKIDVRELILFLFLFGFSFFSSWQEFISALSSCISLSSLLLQCRALNIQRNANADP